MTNRSFRVYVVKLRKGILRNRSFRKANPEYRKGKPCVYVGSTAKTPKERLAVHMDDPIKGSSKVRKYGKGLFAWAFEDLPEHATRDEAEAAEKAHAEDLRSRGWGVWQN